MNNLNHPQVTESSGGGMCPVQYCGRLIDGRYFYFRYRGGYASLDAGPLADPEDVRLGYEHPMPAWRVPSTVSVGMDFGGMLQGYFEDDQERDVVFATLIDLLNRTPHEQPEPA